jgi:hypothetical protein
MGQKGVLDFKTPTFGVKVIKLLANHQTLQVLKICKVG